MNKINETSKVIGIIVIAVIVVALGVLYGKHINQSATSTDAGAATTNTGTAATVAAATTTGTSASGNATAPVNTNAGTNRGTSAPVAAVPPIIIHFITPVPNDVWTIGVTNPISWDNAGNITAEIDLLDAKGNFVGVITSQTGPQETSYPWDTREYALSRYNPLKKEVVPGTYKIRITFDGNNLPPIVSPTITISN